MAARHGGGRGVIEGAQRERTRHGDGGAKYGRDVVFTKSSVAMLYDGSGYTFWAQTVLTDGAPRVRFK